VTKETGSPHSESIERTAAAELVLPGDYRIVPASAALGEAIEIFEIDIAVQFPLALFESKLRSISQKPGIASIGKALSTRRPAGPRPIALCCLRILRTGCVWTGTGALNRAKRCVTMNANGSSIFINDFPL
jgi:hypothetical protein